jgi:hypothetical protein
MTRFEALLLWDIVSQFIPEMSPDQGDIPPYGEPTQGGPKELTNTPHDATNDIATRIAKAQRKHYVRVNEERSAFADYMTSDTPSGHYEWRVGCAGVMGSGFKVCRQEVRSYRYAVCRQGVRSYRYAAPYVTQYQEDETPDTIDTKNTINTALKAVFSPKRTLNE